MKQHFVFTLALMMGVAVGGENSLSQYTDAHIIRDAGRQTSKRAKRKYFALIKCEVPSTENIY